MEQEEFFKKVGQELIRLMGLSNQLLEENIRLWKENKELIENINQIVSKNKESQTEEN